MPFGPETAEAEVKEAVPVIPHDQAILDYNGPKKVIPEPNLFERVETFLGVVARDPRDAVTLRHLADENKFSVYALPLLAGEYIPFSSTADAYIEFGVFRKITNLTRNTMRKRVFRQGQHESENADHITWPMPTMLAPVFSVDPDVRRQSMAIIGDGPAGLLMARMRAEMKYKYTSLYGLTDMPGGIWNHDRVADEGHNTFSTIQAFGHQLSSKGARLGVDLQLFLRQIANRDVLGMHRHGKVTHVAFDPADEKYVVTSRESGSDVTKRFDSVLVTTGNAQPKDFNASDAPMKTNVGGLKHVTIIKRWQEQIPPEKWKTFEGTNPVMVGLGNSTMAMIGEFMKMREKGIHVEPVILTHHTYKALHSPDKIVDHNGKPEGPLFRTRSNLSRLAGDIEKINERYRLALKEGWILPGVTEWNLKFEGGESGTPFLEVHTGNGRMLTIRNIPMIYALIGYQNNPTIMKDFGCHVEENGSSLDFDPLSHQVRPVFADSGRMYVAGAAASRRQDRNQEVIPGTMRVIGEIALAELVRGYRTKPSMLKRIMEDVRGNAFMADLLPKQVATDVVPAEVLVQKNIAATQQLAREQLQEVSLLDPMLQRSVPIY